MRDVTLPPGVERSLDVSLAKVAEASGFTLQHHRLDLVGLCEECAD